MTVVLNVQERVISIGAREVGSLVDSLSSADDRLWPTGAWPAMRFDRPLGVGGVGGHGPVRYVVDDYDPGRLVRFRFTRPEGFAGHHSFSVSETAANVSVLRHELVMTVTGASRLTWPLFFRPLHDALIEEALDRAQLAAGLPPDRPATRSAWVRTLRWASSLPRDRRRRRHP